MVLHHFSFIDYTKQAFAAWFWERLVASVKTSSSYRKLSEDIDKLSVYQLALEQEDPETVDMSSWGVYCNDQIQEQVTALQHEVKTSLVDVYQYGHTHLSPYEYSVSNQDLYGDQSTLVMNSLNEQAMQNRD